MASRWKKAAKLLGTMVCFLPAWYAMRPLDQLDFEVLFTGWALLMLVALLAQTALRSYRPSLTRNADPAHDLPADAMSYDVVESEWIHGKLLYRGIHDSTGLVRRIGRSIIWMVLIYLLFAGVNYALRGDDFFRIPATAVLALITFVVVYVILDSLVYARESAVRTFVSRGPFWWPAKIAWSTEAISIRNGEGNFRYPLQDCTAWKEDASLILLYTADSRYWCLPKRAFAALFRHDSLEHLLQERVAKISPYKVVRRWV